MNPEGILKRFGRLVDRRGLVWGRSGNMSLRIGDDEFLITGRGACLGELQDEDMVICRISKDSSSKGPSMEFRMHREIYRARNEILAVLHSQPLFSTLVASSRDLEIRKDLVPEAMVYLKEIGRIPYLPPGSIELALKVGRKIQDADLLLLENHGVVAAGTSMEEVVNKTETLEFLCKLIVFARASGIELKGLAERENPFSEVDRE